MKSIHPVRLGLFLALSGLDLYLTWRLLRDCGDCIGESNPLARVCWSCYGFTGLALFKAAMVVQTTLLCVVISFYRPRASGLVLTFACCLLSGVVVYSSYLLGFGGYQDDILQSPSALASVNR